MATDVLEPESQPLSAAEIGAQLKQDTAAVRLRHRKFGVRRSLSRGQVTQAAETFHADGHFMSASKKLIDTSDEDYRQVLSVIRTATMYWRMVTVPYPDPGIRLIRRAKIDEFNERMDEFHAQLVEGVAKLQERYTELREAAKTKLADLFNAGDYPASISGEFSLTWEYPSVEPPDYLKELSPELYKQEQERIAKRFEEAVTLAEDAFRAELADLVSNLVEKLQAGEDGKKKQIRKSAVGNLTEFFTRFRDLNIGSDEQLEKLVDDAQKVVQGIDADQLRKDETLRNKVAEDLGNVKQILDTLIEEKPTRDISLDDED